MNELIKLVLQVHSELERINGHNALQTSLRLMKVQEEAGEVAGAWIGFRGQNPRKGITHDRSDVAKELMDVVVTALVAIPALGFDLKDEIERATGKLADYVALYEEVNGS